MEPELRDQLQLDDVRTTELRTHIDDEYATAGVTDPKVMVTTSRDPSSRLKQFAKELRLIVPDAQRMNRGKYQMKDLVDMCRASEVNDLLIVHEHRGEPDGLVVCHLPYGPTAYFGLSNAILRHDLNGKDTDGSPNHFSQAFPHLVFDNFDSPLGGRVQNILKFLFPVPKPDSKRVLTFQNVNDFISFRHHTYTKSGHKASDVVLTECGPRFEMRLFQIKLGTVDMDSAEDEWVLRPYMNSATKKNALSTTSTT